MTPCLNFAVYGVTCSLVLRTRWAPGSTQSSRITTSQLALPTAGRVAHCLHSWMRITSNPWTLEVMRGYHLEFSHPPFQTSPCHTVAKSPTGHQDIRGDTSPTPEASSEEGQLQLRRICEQDVSGPQQRWLLLSSGELEATQLLHTAAPFQNGRDSDLLRLDVFHQPERCIPIGEYLSGIPAISLLHLDGDHIWVHLSALWTEQCSKRLHKVDETCDGLPEGTGFKNLDNLLNMNQSVAAL